VSGPGVFHLPEQRIEVTLVQRLNLVHQPAALRIDTLLSVEPELRDQGFLDVETFLYP